MEDGFTFESFMEYLNEARKVLEEGLN